MYNYNIAVVRAYGMNNHFGHHYGVNSWALFGEEGEVTFHLKKFSNGPFCVVSELLLHVPTQDLMNTFAYLVINFFIHTIYIGIVNKGRISFL